MQKLSAKEVENPGIPETTVEADFVEIVEEGNLEPNAVDKLNELLGF